MFMRLFFLSVFGIAVGGNVQAKGSELGKAGQRLKSRLGTLIKKGQAIGGVLTMCALASCQQMEQVTRFTASDTPTVAGGSPSQYDELSGDLVTFQGSKSIVSGTADANDKAAPKIPLTVTISQRTYGDFVIDISDGEGAEQIYAVIGPSYRNGGFDVYDGFSASRNKIGTGSLTSSFLHGSGQNMTFTLEDTRDGYPDREIALTLYQPRVSDDGTTVSRSLDLTDTTGKWFERGQVGIKLRGETYFDAQKSRARAASPSNHGFTSYSSGIAPLSGDTGRFRLASFQPLRDQALVDLSGGTARQTLTGIEVAYNVTTNQGNNWDFIFQMESDDGSDVEIPVYVRDHSSPDAHPDEFLLYDSSDDQAKVIGDGSATVIGGRSVVFYFFDYNFGEFEARINMSINQTRESNVRYRLGFDATAKQGIAGQTVSFPLLGTAINRSFSLSDDGNYSSGILLQISDAD